MKGWELAAREAVRLVKAGMRVGLGTGRAASAFVRELAASRLEVVCVPTSEATRTLAESLGLSLTTLEVADELDVTVDGADEVSPALDLIKGLGGALVREKIVAASSHRLVIVVGGEKIVTRLGERTPLPVEIVPFARGLCTRRIESFGASPRIRVTNGGTFVTDNGNWILDCAFQGIDDPIGLDRRLLEIPGVVGTGLFTQMADRVIVQDGESLRILDRR